MEKDDVRHLRTTLRGIEHQLERIADALESANENDPVSILTRAMDMADGETEVVKDGVLMVDQAGNPRAFVEEPELSPQEFVRRMG